MRMHEQLLTAAGEHARKPFGATSTAPALAAATALLGTLALWSLANAPPGETPRGGRGRDLAPAAAAGGGKPPVLQALRCQTSGHGMGVLAACLGP